MSLTSLLSVIVRTGSLMRVLDLLAIAIKSVSKRTGYRKNCRRMGDDAQLVGSRRHFQQQPQGCLPLKTLFTGTDTCTATDDVRLQYCPCHLLQQYKAILSPLAVATSADCSIATDYVHLKPCTKHLQKYYKSRLPLHTLLTRTDRSTATDHI